MQELRFSDGDALTSRKAETLLMQVVMDFEIQCLVAILLEGSRLQRHLQKFLGPGAQLPRFKEQGPGALG